MWFMQLVVYFCLLGLVGGLIIDPLLQAFGIHLRDHEPVWFIISCAIVVGSALVAEAIRARSKHTDPQ